MARLQEGCIPKYARLVIVHIGTNNVQSDTAEKIDHGILCIQMIRVGCAEDAPTMPETLPCEPSHIGNELMYIYAISKFCRSLQYVTI